MIDLKAQFGGTYRIALDESAEILEQTTEDRAWLQQIPGKHGHVYIHGVEILGAFTNRPRRLVRLLAIPGVKLHQRGDREATVTFPPKVLDRVAEILQLRRRRQVSESERQRLAAMSAPHRFGPRRTESISDAPIDPQGEA